MSSYPGPDSLVIGELLPDFDLVSPDGERFSQDSFSPESLLAILFLANHCREVSAHEDYIVMLAVEHIGRGAAFAAISSSDVTRFPEDAPDGMAERSIRAHYPFPYLFDGDGSVARAFGAVCTPEAFIFDHARRLRYRGAILGARKGDATPYLARALDGLLNGNPPQTNCVTPVGCPIELLK